MIKTLMLAAAITVVTFLGTLSAYADSDSMSDGVVRKVDMENGKITIRHGEIVNLDMPPMSMVFTAKDPAILEAIAKGDKVKFVAAEENGTIFVTEIKADK